MSAARHAARSGALVLVERERAVLVVSGPDRVTWLNGVLTCDLRDAAPGRCLLGLALSKHGKILTDLVVAASADRIFLAVPSRLAAELADHLARLLVMEDAELADQSAALSWLTLHGPRSAELVAGIAAEHALAHGTLDLTGLGGAALVVDRARVGAAVDALTAAGPDVVVGSNDDWHQLRIERGVGALGVDFGPDDNPHEAALDQRAVSWTKGCYLGQEVVCMQGMRGRVKRRLVGLALEGDQPVPVGAPLLDGAGQTVGEVTSSARSTGDGRVRALGRISGAAVEAGAPLRVGSRTAAIVERPDSA